MSRRERDRRLAAQRAGLALGQNIVVLDTETTGLGRGDEIIEISCVNRDGEVLLDTLVKPRVRISPQAALVNGLRNRDLEDAPDMAVLMDTLEPILAAADVIASYNLDFDGRLLRQSNGPGYRLPAGTGRLCIMRAYAEFRGEWNRDLRGYRWHKLADAMRACGARARGTPHGSLQNALGALAVLRHIALDGMEQDPAQDVRQLALVA